MDKPGVVEVACTALSRPRQTAEHARPRRSPLARAGGCVNHYEREP